MKSFWKTVSIVVLAGGATLAFSNQSLFAGSPGHGGGHGFNLGIGSHFDLGLGRFDRRRFDFNRNRFGFGFDGFGFDGFGLNGFGLWGCDLEGNDNHIPFYALHPPVYYSRIVPRAMGWTPFAYSPDAIILPLDEGGPKQIINPFVPPINEPIPTPAPSVKAKPSADKTAADSDSIRVIINPYVGTTLANRVD